jgi:tripeptide aminopeptidase
MASPLIDLFLDAVRVDAPSLHEAPMAAFVRKHLAGLPIRIVEDDAAAVLGTECGNLICIPHTFSADRPATVLFAHLDTPSTTAAVRPVVTADRISSDGSTILGVDNRAGVSVLLQALRSTAQSNPRGNAMVVFTVAEELGMWGAKHVDLSPYNVRMAYVFDCSRRPGTFIQSCVGSSLYTATFLGRASHAGVAPEKGINAIQVAARAIAQIRIGRLAPKMTANVGTIKGGVATNVVPDRCVVEGEVRSFIPADLDRYIDEITSIFQRTSQESLTTVTMQSAVDFAPFVLSSDAPVFQRACTVLRRLGLEPNPIEYLGGSDANMLNAKNIPAVNFGIGAQNPHGTDEFILFEDFERAYAIAHDLIQRAPDEIP